MDTITIQKAKTNLSRLIERACQGEEIVIARGNKPVVRLVPIHDQPRKSKDQHGKRKSGAWKGKIEIGTDFFKPLPPEELQGWK